jgi:hypothetical protein
MGVSRAEVEAAVTRLQDEHAIDIGMPIAGLSGRWLVWKD